MRTTTKVSLGLLAAWAAHDLEELLTLPATSREVLARLPRALPIPEELRRQGLSQRHVAVSIGGMGVLMAAAAVDGARSGGRSPFFRGALFAFGVHGFGHVGASVARRGYTSGVLTAPTVVVPYWLWARRRLAAEGLPDVDRRAAVTAAAMLPLLPGLHVVTHLLLRRRGPRARAPRGNLDHPGSD